MNELEQERFAVRAQAWQPTQPIALLPGHLWIPFFYSARDHLCSAILVYLPPCHILHEEGKILDRPERNLWKRQKTRQIFISMKGAQKWLIFSNLKMIDFDKWGHFGKFMDISSLFFKLEVSTLFLEWAFRLLIYSPHSWVVVVSNLYII